MDKLGNITLHLADCMDILRSLPDGAFDLAIVDPPYGIGAGMRKGRCAPSQSEEKYHDAKYKTSEWDAIRPSEEYFRELFRCSKNRIIWGGNYFCDHLPVSRGWIFWDKAPIIDNYSDGELAWTSFDCVLRRKKIPWNGKIRTGIEPTYKSIHPTQKPVALYEWLLAKYAKPGDMILDTHLGSGSSAIAAHNGGFEFVGIELDPDYSAAAKQRLQTHQMQAKLF